MYDLTGHAGLSDDAKNLGPDEMEFQLRVAQRVLGFSGTDYTGSVKLAAEDALAMQVSLQVATDPMAFLASSETKGIQSVTWRGDVPIHPLALQIAEELFSENLGDESEWPDLSRVAHLK
jgi:hypothetical protein